MTETQDKGSRVARLHEASCFMMTETLMTNAPVLSVIPHPRVDASPLFYILFDMTQLL